jgi:predicted histidine transporter YuiF (NhaC family)
MKIPKPAIVICLMAVLALIVSVVVTYTRPRPYAASLEEPTGSLPQGPSGDKTLPWSDQTAVPF